MVKAKYDTIGSAYDDTRKADPGITNILRQLLELGPVDKLLDIGCGTGNYSNAVWQTGLNMTGLDPSDVMLNKAKIRNDQITWVKGKVEQLPFTDNTFTKVLGTLTIHHWTSLNQGFNEIFRVLQPRGRLVLFTSTSEQMRGYWLNHYFPNMLEASIQQMPDRNEVLLSAQQAGLSLEKVTPWSIPNDLMDQFLYCGKAQPELYFDSKIRNGISSFRSLANKNEVDIGLKALRRDIDDGSWQKIKKRYENDDGDYLFIVMSKTDYKSDI